MYSVGTFFDNDAFIIPLEISSPSPGSPVMICAVSGSEDDKDKEDKFIYIYLAI